MLRRGIVAVLLLAMAAAHFHHAAADEVKIVVVYASGVEAYTDALNGIRAGLQQSPGKARFVDIKGANGGLLESLAGARIVITVGSEALGSVLSRKSDVPVLSTMILHSDSHQISTPGASNRVAAGVYLDVPIAGLLPELRSLFPSKNRLGVIRNPVRPAREDASLAARIKQSGFAPEVVDCTRPEDLLRAFSSLKGKADFVLVFPDSSLYNAATVKPLILASLDHRLPIIGFSSSFVRAGAAIGIYPDFQDVGYQTVEVMNRYLAGQASTADESPRKLAVAVNQRILRLLGLGLKSSQETGLVTFH